MDLKKTQADLEMSFSKAHDALREVWPSLTPMQRVFLIARWHQQPHYRTDQEAAKALGLNPGTPHTWRWRSDTFRRAEQLIGESFLETAKAAQFVDYMRGYDRRLEKTMAKRKR